MQSNMTRFDMASRVFLALAAAVMVLLGLGLLSLHAQDRELAGEHRPHMIAGHPHSDLGPASAMRTGETAIAAHAANQ